MNGTKGKLNCRMNIGVSVLGILASAFGTAVQADEVGSSYVMTVLSEEAQGERLISGDYERAIENITATARNGSGRFAESNNLCVAYAKTNELDKAAQACDEAVRRSRLSGAYGYNDDVETNIDRALALSNRGVVRAVSGDEDGARKDFIRALRANSRLEAPAENLAHLEVKTMRAASSP